MKTHTVILNLTTEEIIASLLPEISAFAIAQGPDGTIVGNLILHEDEGAEESEKVAEGLYCRSFTTEFDKKLEVDLQNEGISKKFISEMRKLQKKQINPILVCAEGTLMLYCSACGERHM